MLGAHLLFSPIAMPLRVASPKPREEEAPPDGEIEHQTLEKFQLYETRQRFYLIGSDKSKKYWRVLKIDRSEPFELNMSEDPVAYTQQERNDLLQRIADGNRATGGLNFVTKAFGIAGCVKFLGSYYLILITKRRQVGTICDHAIYGIEESQILTIPHSTVQTEAANSKAELRYKKLLSSVDLTKDFFFSCTYPMMQSLQRNMLVDEAERMPYENMFVWNSFLTRAIRQTLNNCRWIVALIHGSFEQVKMSIFGRVFAITLIARRSRHFAGTRYLKRGVNDKGRVANDVETEQIITKEESPVSKWEVASVVQMRGSIPLFWSQEASRLSPKPDIILQRYDPTYQSTRSHFEDLEKRYGNPIIVLNLIKKVEKRPREMMLRREFEIAVDYLNKILPEASRLQFIHWDFHKFAKSKSANVLAVLGGVASQALDRTGFYCSGKPYVVKSHLHQRNAVSSTSMKSGEVERVSEDGPQNKDKEVNSKEARYQSGVLRTNCIDCLDRTNVAQYAYGLAALGLQLFALGLSDVVKVEPESSIAGALMDMYQNMGDALALQYGGSAAHNTVFPERHGKWRAATQSQEFLKSIKRYYSNTYTDGEKQDAMNLFLGYFQPQESKPALWELDSDYYLHVGSNGDDSHASDAWYLQMASTENDSWYGCGLLPGSVEDSEANKHYAQFCEVTNLDPFNPALEENEGCMYFSADDIRDRDDASVILEMQSALNEYQDIGKDLGNITSRSNYEDSDTLTHCILGKERTALER
ncbi:hypothetical protein GOP47_0010014 [Adiantum capillus-veneris]|uniref:SAC domain-containing protein n=1 Tax=Adiantum capillus-veneris TaxID=13818 RepID=A0A9D4ZHN2_ADICA|nr:hypothetical protein GOP47_0010014 [Adiantum capillus-veneris]